jgi:hypothetical protein
VPHPGGRAVFLVTISLRTNEQGHVAPKQSTNRHDYVGDSELVLRGFKQEPFIPFRIPQVDATGAVLHLIENAEGRLGALGITVFDADRLLDAYRIGEMAFNLFAVGIAVRREIPLRKVATLIERVERERVAECAIISPVGYPHARCEVSLAYPSPLLRIFSNYAEAVRSTSPFYSFLCLFAIVEFLTRDLQGRLYRLAHEVGVAFDNFSGALSREDVRFLGYFLSGMSYGRLLERTRSQRNAVAHFLIGQSSRPFHVEAEGQIALYKDALRIAARDLLVKLNANTRRLLEAGVSERTLLTAFEGKFEATRQLISVITKIAQLRSE